MSTRSPENDPGSTPDPVTRRRGRRHTSPEPSLLVSMQEASALTGIPPSSVYDLIVRGTLPTVRLPGTRRLWIRRQDLVALIENSIERGGVQ